MGGGGGRAGERASKQASERSGAGAVAERFFFFFLGWARPRTGIWYFFFGVGPPENRNMVRQFDARQYVALTLYAVRCYVALTQHIAVRGYAILTSGARLTDRGARGVVNYFF